MSLPHFQAGDELVLGPRRIILKRSHAGIVPGFYRARVEGGEDRALPEMPAGREYGIQFFRTADEAQRASEFQAICRAAAERRWGAADRVPSVYGWFELGKPSGAAVVQEWVEGRPWKLEINDRWLDRRPPPPCSGEDKEPEYEAWREFLLRLTRLLRTLGAEDLARRYDWGWIGPARVVLRKEADSCAAGLVAIDFSLPPTDFTAARRFLVEESLSTPDCPPRLGMALVRRNPAVRAPAPTWREAWAEALYPFRLLGNPELRKRWILDQAARGIEEGMLNPQEEDRIVRCVDDPDIQLYIKCMAVHLCLLPATNLIVIAGGIAYSAIHHLSVSESVRLVALGLAFFAVFPISPGSLLRGLFVLGVVMAQRRLRGFKVALALSFWRYVGYMAFPLQMVSAFPALSRFLAARAATETARSIPALGCRGGLLEHRVFDLCFNLPLSLGRRWKRRKKPDS